MVKKYICIPRSFLAINVCNQGKTLWSPCGIHGTAAYVLIRHVPDVMPNVL
jgi:hypothetical protein